MLKVAKDGAIVAGSKRSGTPKSTYINYNDVLTYEQIQELAGLASLSVPDTAIMAVLFALEEAPADFGAYVELKLGRAKEPPAPVAPEAKLTGDQPPAPVAPEAKLTGDQAPAPVAPAPPKDEKIHPAPVAPAPPKDTKETK